MSVRHVCVQNGPQCIFFSFLWLLLKDKSLKHPTLDELESQNFHPDTTGLDVSNEWDILPY